MKSVVPLLIALVVLSGCASQPSTPQSPTPNKADLKTECCEECREGASSDPRAMDISGQPCSYYKYRIVSGKTVLTPECKDYFEKTELRVGECKS